MLKRSIIAAAAALAIGVGGVAATVGPAAADSNFGFYLGTPGFGIYGGNPPRHMRHGPPPRAYSRSADAGCWGWSKRLHQRVWVCGPPHKMKGGPGPGYGNHDHWGRY